MYEIEGGLEKSRLKPRVTTKMTNNLSKLLIFVVILEIRVVEISERNSWLGRRRVSSAT